MFITGFITIGLLATLAKVLKVPFIFPSLGATTFLFFFTPSLPSASPRNAICGHAIGIIAGYSALLLFGLASAPAASAVGIDTSRILAVGFSLGLTGALMIIFKCGHPPGGATTLIVSLGIISDPFSLIVVEIAVVILTLLAISINRLAAIDYPIWKRQPKEGAFTPWSPEKAAATSSSAAITWAIFFFINGFITIGILTAVSMVSKTPFIFPSLGATAFLFFFGPNLPSASPRNAIYGTAIAILSAYFALNICGLANLGSNTSITDTAQIIAAAVALALTGFFMILLKTPHPPAAATCLIVSLGLIASPFGLFILEFAVVLLALQAFVINRLVAIDYPLWKKA
jgi:CBS-domain-containing membrane protein